MGSCPERNFSLFWEISLGARLENGVGERKERCNANISDVLVLSGLEVAKVLECISRNNKAGNLFDLILSLGVVKDNRFPQNLCTNHYDHKIICLYADAQYFEKIIPMVLGLYFSFALSYRDL